MNRQTIAIGAVLFAAVAVALGVWTYLGRDRSDGGGATVSGPGRAGEARAIISDIEARRRDDQSATPAAGAGEVAATGEPETAPSDATAPSGATTSSGNADSDLDAAFERARQLQAAGKLDDAQVLYFFGARRGHARSAFAYAEMNDPNHHSPETSLLAEPNAFQAFRWYKAALDGGIPAAAERLEALHEWARKAAADGDAEAQRLLLQWE
jgi:hypothetical protein